MVTARRTRPHSPLGMEDLDLLKQTVLFTGEGERYLRMAGDVLEDQIEDVLDVWYGFVGDHPHLISTTFRALTARTPTTSGECASVPTNGYSTLAADPTTRNGWTTSRRSGCVTPTSRGTRPTASTGAQTTSVCGT